MVRNQAMKACYLCQKNQADKAGSHIIPQLIIESMINDGAKGRDKEKSYSLSSIGVGKFIGRSVLPEEFKKDIGREITDEDIENNISPYIIDNLLCSRCESFLANLEGIYSDSVHQRVKAGEYVKPEGILYYFWMSVIFRCSASRFGKFQLTEKLECSIRNELIDIQGETRKEIQDNTETPGQYELMILYQFNENNSNHIVCDVRFSDPYLFCFNEYIVLFHEINNNSLRDVEEEIKVNLRGLIDGPINFSPVDEESMKSINRVYSNLAAKQILDNPIRTLKKAYLLKNKKPLPKSILESILKELSTGEGHLTDTFSSTQIMALILKYLNK